MRVGGSECIFFTYTLLLVSTLIFFLRFMTARKVVCVGETFFPYSVLQGDLHGHNNDDKF